MAFVVEDGTIVPHANSYATLEAANSFHADRGNTGWTGSEDAKKAALIKATDYIEQVYGERFIGELVSEDQSLSWPRVTSRFDFDIIPEKLILAVCDLALEALSGRPLIANVETGIKRKKVGPIEKEYLDGGVPQIKRRTIDGYLRGLVISRINVPVVRV